MTTSKQPDWDSGPPDATHYHDASDGLVESWYKHVPGEELQVMNNYTWNNCKPKPYWSGNPTRTVDQLVARPDPTPENDVDNW